MGIGHFIVFMGVLFLVLAIALFMFISVNLSKQFDSTSMLMDYSAHWNSIFVSMMEVSSILDILPAEEGDEGFARYAEASGKLSQAIDSFLLAYDEDEETRNVLRRLQSFNIYQMGIMEDWKDPVRLYQDRRYVDTAIERHTEEVLELYKDQMDMELARYSAIERQSTRAATFSFLFIAFISLMISGLYLWFGMDIRSMIGKAVNNLDGISHGYWNVPDLKDGKFEEFRNLFDGINRLKHRLSDYFQQIQSKAEIEKSLLDEKLKNEMGRRLLISAEMDMLRSQVNPHFLFNSLTQIGMAVLVKEPAQVLDMVECTGRILRYSLYNKEHLVSLSDELAIVETYIRLYKMSHAEDVEFSISYTSDIPKEELDSRLIVPMCIQPVVENSLKHGFGRDRSSISIRIFIGISDGCLLVTIKDTGVGIENTEKALESNKKGIGLNNIRRRLELQYGDHNLIKVSSIVGQCTIVALRFPEEVRDESPDR